MCNLIPHCHQLGAEFASSSNTFAGDLALCFMADRTLGYPSRFIIRSIRAGKARVSQRASVRTLGLVRQADRAIYTLLPEPLVPRLFCGTIPSENPPSRR